jgi:uncharacterized protein
MTSDPLCYDQWIADALLSVVTRSLSVAADEGLPGDHHFYVTFNTGSPGVEVPSHIKARYPEDMTIVLQHQYWDLLVDEDVFEVTLKFQGRNTRLRVPMSAVTAFADPSVNFGLQLKAVDPEEAAELIDIDAADGISAETAPANVAPKPIPAELADGDLSDNDAEQTDAEEPKKGEIITLDAFRKK